MVSGEHWEQFSFQDWEELACKWLSGIREQKGENETRDLIIMMNFTASPELQWQFIQIAVTIAGSDEELDAIGAGPIEHLLGWHGKDYIQLVEDLAAKDPKFLTSLRNVWKYRMDEEVWSRLLVLKASEMNILTTTA